jgi:cytochrome P450
MASDTLNEMSSLARMDPVTAATAAEPYGFYSRLVAERPMYFDPGLQLWVASSAEVVADVLANPRCRVRPAAELVPKPLTRSVAGEVFGALVRMSDGERHRALKRAVERAFESCPTSAAETSAAVEAAKLGGSLPDERAVTRFAFRFPIHVMSTLLGVGESVRPEVAEATVDFSTGLAPNANEEQRALGSAAAERLRAVLAPLVANVEAGSVENLFETFQREARANSIADDGIVANGIGFLFQTCDATAGLIGNTLVALGRRPEVFEHVKRHQHDLHAVVEEVARFDPPVQNTRRFVESSGPVAGETIQAGAVILVLLAAANRDPAANPDPDSFDLHRPNRLMFTFGAGGHACPGGKFAVAIAAAGVSCLLEDGLDPRSLVDRFTYRPSVNLRVPLFGRS